MPQAVWDKIEQLGYTVVVKPTMTAATLVTFDLDDVLNRTTSRGHKRWNNPALLLQDEPNLPLLQLLFRLKHVQHLTDFEVAIVTNRQADSATVKYTLDYLESHGLNGIGLVMRTEDFNPHLGLMNKHKVILTLGSKFHVDDKKKEVLDRLYPEISVFHFNTLDAQHWRDREKVVDTIVSHWVDTGLMVLPTEAVNDE